MDKERKKKKGIFGGLFAKKKGKDAAATPKLKTRPGSRAKRR